MREKCLGNMKPTLTKPATTKKNRPRTASTPSSCNTPRPMRLPRKWRTSGRRLPIGSTSTHGCHDVCGNSRVIFLLGHLREDVFQRRSPIVAKVGDPAVGHHLAAMQDYHAFANLFDHVEPVRAEENRPAFARQCLEEGSEQQ